MSDFKTNEYANLLGGKEFEPVEENPMIGFRGASRYYNPLYKDGFKLECEAMKVVRNEMGLTNVKLMIPFCRTVEEGKKVIEVMKENGLERGQNGLEIYVMAEIPSNVLLAEEFAEVFDGFSIGSNDLTQLTLGIDRDSALVADLFSEQNDAAKLMIATVIEKAKKVNAKIGLCGQAPSDFPEFAGFLVEKGIDSISFNPDALFKGIDNIKKAEAKILVHH
jgi:pyruvate,water dikinase